MAMRYEVGKKYLFINVDFERGEDRFGSLYFPWADTINTVETVVLTCTEHHKVPTEWSDNVNADGFRFEDQDGNVWNNQYPYASYGQMDTSRDSKVARDVVDPMNSTLRDVDVLWGWTDALAYINNVIRAVNPKSMAYLGDNAVDELAALEDWLETLKKIVGEAMDGEVVIDDLIITKLDGSTMKTTIKQASIVPNTLVDAA